MTQPRKPLPAWIETLADLVAANILPIDPLAPLGCHVTRADEAWEITLFVSDTEIVGGAGDGLRRPSRFEFDMMPLLCLFAEIDGCTWQSARCGPEDQLGAHFAISGKFADEPVRLRILGRAPRRFPAGRRVDVHEQTCEDLW